MKMHWTKERITALTQQGRYDLWNNANRLGAEDLVRMIEECGLAYTDPKGLKLDTPVGREMAKIVNSPQGVAAAIGATNQGLPALAAIDPLLKAALEDKYAKTYEATIQAGYLVTKMMQKNGYQKTGRQGSLIGCVAKSGEIFTLIK
ncbi:hypothetical protein [Mesorhizobium onobrychidis]|uniref:Uncharacterized protein n=1 Tax=Mesorhizobium onobrychidis TaxID=2775404 RepID=A0ABY5R771_9HYPH|nr:hypothetical protein [Mesorhizobium onobrychidis]UVC19375.1 hypothetical protein IHQ72_35525 [Mesorhizobium onobrychidis]